MLFSRAEPQWPLTSLGWIAQSVSPYIRYIFGHSIANIFDEIAQNIQLRHIW